MRDFTIAEAGGIDDARQAGKLAVRILRTRHPHKANAKAFHVKSISNDGVANLTSRLEAHLTIERDMNDEERNSMKI